MLQGAAGYCCLVLLLGCCWVLLWALLGFSGLPWATLGLSLGLFWCSLGALLVFLGACGPLLGSPGPLLGLSWAVLGPSWTPSRPQEAPRSTPKTTQEGSKSHLPEVCFRGLCSTPFWEAFLGAQGVPFRALFLCSFGARVYIAFLPDGYHV